MEETNGAHEEVAPTTDGQAEKDAFLAKARDAGWSETTAFDYNAYQRSGGENAPEWMANAKVYEWNDEFGDVGPEIPQLEDMLFGSEFQMKKGTSINNIFEFEVQIEGPVKIDPIRKVSDFPSA